MKLPGYNLSLQLEAAIHIRSRGHRELDVPASLSSFPSPQSAQLRPNPWHGCQGRPSHLSPKESRQCPYKHAHRPTWATQPLVNMFFWDDSRVCQPGLHSPSLVCSSGMILESVKLAVKTNLHKSCRNKLGTSRTHKQDPVLYNMTINIWVWFL